MRVLRLDLRGSLAFSSSTSGRLLVFILVLADVGGLLGRGLSGNRSSNLSALKRLLSGSRGVENLAGLLLELLLFVWSANIQTLASVFGLAQISLWLLRGSRLGSRLLNLLFLGGGLGSFDLSCSLLVHEIELFLVL